LMFSFSYAMFLFYFHMQCFGCNILIFICFIKNVGSVSKSMGHPFQINMSHMCHACKM
jgi:hypothetical protein